MGLFDKFEKSKQEDVKETIANGELIATSNTVQGYTGSINFNVKDEEVKKY